MHSSRPKDAESTGKDASSSEEDREGTTKKSPKASEDESKTTGRSTKRRGRPKAKKASDQDDISMDDEQKGADGAVRKNEAGKISTSEKDSAGEADEIANEQNEEKPAKVSLRSTRSRSNSVCNR
jgi:hypothetical protein